jgi:hypothetical protein
VSGAIVRELREAPKTAQEKPERAEEPRPDASDVQEGVGRPWLRRVLGG